MVLCAGIAAEMQETSAKKAEDTRPDWRTAFIHMVSMWLSI